MTNLLLWLEIVSFVLAWIVGAWSWLYPEQPKERWLIVLVWLFWPIFTAAHLVYLLGWGWRKECRNRSR